MNFLLLEFIAPSSGFLLYFSRYFVKMAAGRKAWQIYRASRSSHIASRLVFRHGVTQVDVLYTSFCCWGLIYVRHLVRLGHCHILFAAGDMLVPQLRLVSTCRCPRVCYYHHQEAVWGKHSMLPTRPFIAVCLSQLWASHHRWPWCHHFSPIRLSQYPLWCPRCFKSS